MHVFSMIFIKSVYYLHHLSLCPRWSAQVYVYDYMLQHTYNPQVSRCIEFFYLLRNKSYS